MFSGLNVVPLGYDRDTEPVVRSMLCELGAKVDSDSSEGSICLSPPLYTGPLPSRICVNDFWFYETVAAGSLQPYEDFPLGTNWKPLGRDHVWPPH